MSTEVRNWDVVAKAMEAAGATSSEMYVRAKALALGKLDPMPTSSPEAPVSYTHVLRRLSLGFLASAISVPGLTAIAFMTDAIAEVSL